MLKIHLSLFLSLLILNCYSQSSINAAGGSICGVDGSISYSIGQVFYFEESGAQNSITQGVQQATKSNFDNLACYETLNFDSENCLYTIEGDMPEEPSIDCFQVVSFDETLCEYILEEAALESTETYVGCSGDEYSITINGTEYNEANPTGTESLISNAGCDSIIMVDLIFEICDPCDLNENKLGLNVIMKSENGYAINSNVGITMNKLMTKDQVISEILKRQDESNKNKSLSKHSLYDEDTLTAILSRLQPNVQVGM